MGVGEDFVERHLSVGSRSGSEWMCVCPFHGDSHPSMSVNVEKRVFICFACGEKGHFNRIAEHLGVPGIGSVAEEVELVSAVRRAVEEQEEKREFYLPDSYLEQYTLDRGLWYWVDERGLSVDTVEAFELGFDIIEHAAVCPMRDISGNLLGISRRYIDHADYRWKYQRNRYQKSKHLYLGHACWHQSTLVVVEGQVDALTCWEVGYPAVAICGASPSEEQARLLRRLGPERLVTAFDNDQAGSVAHRALLDLVDFAEVRRAQYPAKDPGSAPHRSLERALRRA